MILTSAIRDYSMKTSFSILFAMLAMNTALHASSYAYELDDSYEKAISATMFNKVDTDKDGRVTFEEIYEFRTADERKRNKTQADDILRKCDKNKDGEIAKDELAEQTTYTYDPQAHIDPNYCPLNTETMEMVDIDEDGVISKKELMNMSSNQQRPSKKIRKKMKSRQDKQMQELQKEQFKRCDKDEDQFLTLREAASMNCNIYTEMFDTKDKDSDSLLSEKEMMASAEPPKFEGKLGNNGYEEYKYEMPPSTLLMMQMSTCDENDNNKLELIEMGGKECEVDLTFFNSVDENGDGAIDHTETKRMHMKQTFDELDANKDGWLDDKEFVGSRIRYM